MKPKASSLALMLIAILPLQVTLPREKAETTIRIDGGTGQYLDSVEQYLTGYCEVGVGDCFGGSSREAIYRYEPQKAAFREVGIEIDHKPARSPIHVGVRGHTIAWDSAPTHLILNPYLTMEGRGGAAGLGMVISNRILPGLENRSWRVIPSFFLRAGARRFHLTASFLNELPLLSNGYFQLGVGVVPLKSGNVEGWVGVSGIPFNNPGLSAKTRVWITPLLALNLSGRLGSSSGQRWRVSESTVSAGFSVRLKPAAPRKNTRSR